MTSRDETLHGPGGDLRVRVYEPSSTPRVGLVWAHGGSFFGGNIDMPEADQVGRRIAEAGIVVLSVDYHLAPVSEWWAAQLGLPLRDGVRYPVPQDELTVALEWARHAGLGPAADAWSLGGASAGASLAASAARRLREAARPRTIVLAYPTVHAILPDPAPDLAAAMKGLPAEHRFTPDAVAEMNRNHAGTGQLGPRHPAFAGGQDLTGLPPVLIVNSEYDDLRASGEQFARELEAYGVDVTLALESGSRHGHLNIEGSDEAVRSIATVVDWLREH